MKMVTLFALYAALFTAIPRIIVYTGKSNHLNPSWYALNPGFKMMYFNDKGMTNLIRLHRPDFIPYLDTMAAVEKADVFRYLALFEFGGIYTDVDVVCVESVVKWYEVGRHASGDLRTFDFFVGVELDDVQPRHGTPLQFVQWVFGSSRKNPLLDNVLNMTLQSVRSRPRYSDDDVLVRTGPVVFTKAVLDFISRTGPLKGTIESLFFSYPRSLVTPKTLSENGQTVLLKHYDNNNKLQKLNVSLFPYRSFGFHPQHNKPNGGHDHLVEHRFSGSWRSY